MCFLFFIIEIWRLVNLSNLYPNDIGCFEKEKENDAEILYNQTTFDKSSDFKKVTNVHKLGSPDADLKKNIL